MANLFNQLERSLQIQETKTKTKNHDTELRWVGWDIDLLRNMVSTDQLSALNDDAYLIRVGDKYVFFNRGELTEDLVDEIKSKLGI